MTGASAVRMGLMTEGGAMRLCLTAEAEPVYLCVGAGLDFRNIFQTKVVDEFSQLLKVVNPSFDFVCHNVFLF